MCIERINQIVKTTFNERCIVHFLTSCFIIRSEFCQCLLLGHLRIVLDKNVKRLHVFCLDMHHHRYTHQQIAHVILPNHQENMRCKSCGNDDDKVLESRTVRGGVAIRRRRVCLQCGHRFTTYEEIVRESLQVVKRDGRLEEFSRPKLLSGVMRACQKRPISMEQIDKLVDSVIDIIEENYDMEIPSHEIGKLLMKQLKKIDEVAAVRFASVYRRFESIDDFVKEVKAIGNDED
jgi:transcriptional repressor NrdR